MDPIFDPPVPELKVTRTLQINGEEVELEFIEPENFEDDQYPIETDLTYVAMFRDSPEPRIIERRVVIIPAPVPSKPKPPSPLKDDPELIKVTSRQPIKIVTGGPDVHVKLRWDGKDELIHGNPPTWGMCVTCESLSVEPKISLTKPTDGRFELLIQAHPELSVGELKFNIEAIGPGKTLSTSFLAIIVEPPEAKIKSAKLPSGSQRRPPYDLKYVMQENWEDPNCWGESWSGEDAGSFEEPTTKTPLTIFINQDMELLAAYREKLLAKKLTEATIQGRINKYTTHVAFHLYQMYEKEKEVQSQPEEKEDIPGETQMRSEIQRVAHTLIKLMEV